MALRVMWCIFLVFGTSSLYDSSSSYSSLSSEEFLGSSLGRLENPRVTLPLGLMICAEAASPLLWRYLSSLIIKLHSDIKIISSRTS
jgi:hypothetical protein